MGSFISSKLWGDGFPVVSPSITLLQLNNAEVTDFSAYLKCKPYLSAKDEKIANFCCQQILSSLQNTAEDISILDVGSGEGSLLTSISQKLSVLTERNINMEIALDCVEPSPEGQEMIIAALGTIKNPRFRYSLFRETIEEFLDRNILPYSIVLCIHSLYFIRRDSWADIISKLLASKNGDVRVVVDVVSRKSDIYQIFDSLCSICDMDRLQRTFDSCGQLYFAEDLEPLLDKLPAHSDPRRLLEAAGYFTMALVLALRLCSFLPSCFGYYRRNLHAQVGMF
jgi:hypothetical protein